MLNISENSISSKIDTKQYKAFSKVESRTSSKSFAKVLVGLLIFAVMVMFVPWTQNINARGYVTTLKPEQRPQDVHSIISGRIEKWFVAEGQYVNKGDTLYSIASNNNLTVDKLKWINGLKSNDISIGQKLYVK